MADSLKDFLVNIGFKIDAASQSRAEAAVKKTETRNTSAVVAESAKRVKTEQAEQDKRERARKDAEKKQSEARAKSLKEAQSYVLKMSAFAVKAVAAVEASALGVVYAVDKAAKGFERLNYMSQRTGASAGKIGAFGYASSQLGSSSDEANSAIEAFGYKLRMNGSGYSQALERLGVKARDANGHLRDTVAIATDLGDALRIKAQNGGKYGYANAVNQASVFGFSENQARAMMSPDFRKREGEFASTQKAVGADPDAAAKSGTAFEQSMRRLDVVLEAIGTKINGVLFVKLKPLLDQLAAWFTNNGDRIATIVSRVADDLVKLAAAIGDKIAGADWSKILDGIEELAKGFDKLATKLGGDTGLTALFTLFGVALAIKVLGPLVKILAALRILGGLALPGWLLGRLGLPGAVAAAGAAGVAALQALPDDQKDQILDKHAAIQEKNKRHFGGWKWLKDKIGIGNPTGNDAIWGRSRKGQRTFKAANGEWNGGGARESATPGVYRPQYRLGDADLSDKVVNTVAGEAVANNRESVDAVINNMLNRVGTTTYGPSGDLQQVARAPGQYAGYRRAGAKEAEFIRARIRAIASGKVEDNTGGSNEYRASWYHGPWYRNHADAPVVGGNRFAYNPSGGRGTFSPYDHPRLPRSGTALPGGASAPNPYGALGRYDFGAQGHDRPIRLGDTPALHQSLTNSRGDTNITSSPTFHINGGNAVANLEAARRMASRGHQDLLRNIQGAEQ